MIKKLLTGLAGLTLAASVAWASTPVGNTWDDQNTVICNNGTVQARFPVCPASWFAGELAGAPELTATLLFSDLISGPDTGLGDGLGSGAIVTVWGQGLGTSQGSSTIEYCDSTDTCRDAAHVYYWKDADGQLPSGPANLYESHGMQEIAFSIPDSAQGAGTIKVTVDGQTDDLDFTVRAGNIYHVTSTGNDSTGDGSWGNPWLTWSEAKDSVTAPGSTIYMHDITSGDPTTDKPMHWNTAAASSGLSNQFAAVAYPNTRPTNIGHRGTSNYNTEGFVISKFDIYAASSDLGANDQPTGNRTSVTMGITGSANGRAVGNAITDEHSSDVNGACASGTQGAIKANNLSANEVENFKVFGNHIYEYGCAGSSKLHHTTYFSNRSDPDDDQLVAPEIAYNYLKDNDAKNGLHYYDETGDCGDYTGTFRIHNNVVVNQGGAGIFIGASCGESADFAIENNVLVNVGNASDWDGLDVETSDGPNTGGISIGYGGWTGDIVVRNNTVYKWNDDDQVGDTQACIGWQTDGASAPASFTVSDNVCWTDKDKPFSNAGCCGATVPTGILTFDNNALYTSVGSPSNAVNPAYATNSILADPLLTVTGSKVSVGAGSPIINQSSTTLTRDIYGATRGATSNVGAVMSSEIAKAFPGAEGVGTDTRGGAGGTVYKVTNLNDSGAGSFREAVTASGPRVVVFDVSGTIDLQSEILISNPYLTVAGQTSPNGVQIAGSRIRINTHDVIWRYMRHRVGEHRNTNELARCLGVYGNGSGLPNDAYNVVIDHSSFAWCSDQQLNAAEDAYDVTFSWNLLTEAMNTNNHGYNMFFWGRYTDIGRAYSVHHNYLANSTFRNPEINYTGRLDFVNNVAYNNVRGSMLNVQWNSDSDSRDEIEINVVGNLNKYGPNTSDTNKGLVDFYQYANDPGSNPIVYESGNIGGNDGTVNILTGTDTNPSFQFWPTVAAGFSTGTPFTFSETIAASTMDTAYAQYVIDNAGANVPARDFIDQRAHDDFDNNTGRIISSVTFPTDWPDLATGAPSAPADTDNDGMADAWETAEGLNVGSDDSATVASGKVYTNIERYINDLASGAWSN